jgi:hypothetical protein
LLSVLSLLSLLSLFFYASIVGYASAKLIVGGFTRDSPVGEERRAEEIPSVTTEGGDLVLNL